MLSVEEAAGFSLAGEKRKRSEMDSSLSSTPDGKSPKRPPFPVPADTPDWARVLFQNLYERICSIECSINQTVNYAVDTAVAAMSEAGITKQLVQKQNEELTEIKAELAQLRQESKQQKDKVTRLEDQSRRDNLLFFGFEEQRGETESDCRQKLYRLLTTTMQFSPQEVDDMKVVRCHRKGPYIQGRNRPIIIKMHWFADRQAIWARKGALRGTHFYINEDYSDVTENKRRQLYPILKAAKNNPWYRDDVFINVDRLVLQGRSYTVDQMTELPSESSTDCYRVQTRYGEIFSEGKSVEQLSPLSYQDRQQELLLF